MPWPLSMRLSVLRPTLGLSISYLQDRRHLPFPWLRLSRPREEAGFQEKAPCLPNGNFAGPLHPVSDTVRSFQYTDKHYQAVGSVI